MMVLAQKAMKEERTADPAAAAVVAEVEEAAMARPLRPHQPIPPALHPEPQPAPWLHGLPPVAPLRNSGPPRPVVARIVGRMIVDHTPVARVARKTPPPVPAGNVVTAAT